jgi:CBS domain containing-hemolysin-like protein
MDPEPCWAAVAAATGASFCLSLVIGALRFYSLARFEALLEGQPRRLEQVQALLADEERLELTLSGLRGLAVVGGTVALTGAAIALALREAQAASAWGWVQVGAEAWLLGCGLLVVLGNLVPVAIGQRRAEPVILGALPLLRPLLRAAAPLGALLAALVRIALRVANVAQTEKEEELKDDILSAAKAGESEGVIDEAAVEVIENLIGFRDVAVSEVMTPRIDVQTVDVSDGREALLARALECEHSRLPVVDGSVDKVVGVLIVKDLLRVQADPQLDPRGLFRKPMFVPETKRVADLLEEFRREQVHMAIVADEYGGTSGVVTIEDVIEELIGDIHDEKDRAEVPIRRLSPTELDVDAKLHLDELNGELATAFPEDRDVETVGGFLALRLGKIPARGDRLSLDGVVLVVTEADERRAKRVRVRLAQ